MQNLYSSDVNVKGPGILFDVNQEVLDVWYEVTFLRFLLTDILQKSPDLAATINDDTFNECRKKAQVFLFNRFKLHQESRGIDADKPDPV